MRNAAILYGFLVCGMFAAAPAAAENEPSAMRREMAGVFDAFKELQPYLIDPSRYADERNEQKILGLIGALRQSFHSVQSFDADVSGRPGFAARLEVLQSALRDAELIYREGSPQYSLLRIKAASNHCVGCHQKYKVRVDLHETPEDLQEHPLYVRGEFYLVSRQFGKAKDAYYRAAQKPENDVQRMDSLLKWLMVQTRLSPDPKAAEAKLRAYNNTMPLTSYDQSVIEGWIQSLHAWAEEKPAEEDGLTKAEALLSQGLPGSDPFLQEIGTVEILRAAGLLHEVLEESVQQTNSALERRRRSLYLLGLAYSKLPSLFVNELPESYFEQCIREFPGTREARASYRFYRELVAAPYIFGNESEIPAELTKQLGELGRLAASGAKRPAE